MGKYLTPKQLENLKNYKYAASNWSFIDKQLAAYWEFCVTLLPLWLAPNLVTFSGFVVMCLNYLVVAFYSSNFTSQDVPSWVWWFSVASLWIYQTLDAIDGKQARRTGSSSPLGQLFDHGCDALTTTIVGCSVHAAMGFQGIASLILHTLHIGPFFVSNWEEFQTGTMRFGVLGVTEGELTHIALYIVTALFGQSFWLTAIPVVGIQLRYALAAGLLIAFLMTTVEALTVVYHDAKSKSKSLTEGWLQFAQFVVFVIAFFAWALGPGSLIQTLPRYYLLSYGLTFGYLISSLIIYHCTHTPFVRFPIVLWPLPAAVLNAYLQIVNEEILIVVYLLFVVVTYLHFVVSMIDEITTYLDIHCFKIKPRPQTPAVASDGSTKKTVDVTDQAKKAL